MPALPLPAALAVAMFLEVFAARAQPEPDPEQMPFAVASGKDLVGRLTDSKSRLRAFYELWRRAAPEKDAGFEEFTEKHYDPEVVICPQLQPEPPLTLVLYGFLSRWIPRLEAGYFIEEPRELFQSPPAWASRARGAQPAIDVFTADGRRIEPFGGDNLLDGLLTDINADAIIDRVEVGNYWIDKVAEVQVLTVSTVEAKTQPLFAVLLNWGADEWTFRLVDSDADGIQDIEAGPRSLAGFKPKAVWKWDRARRQFVGPAGQDGDHFRVLNTEALGKQLEAFKAAGLAFPADADAVAKSAVGLGRTAPPALPAGPFHNRSLQGESDAEVFRFMGAGTAAIDPWLEGVMPNRLPENFWTMDPKSAALALIACNRSDAHRAHYQLVIDDRDKAQPPARCTIAFSSSISSEYAVTGGQYFLHVDPHDSYLAYSRSCGGGERFRDPVHGKPQLDLRFCTLSYEDAHQAAAVIWWLDHARSRDTRADPMEGGHKTAFTLCEGLGKLTLRADGQILISHASELWGESLSARWQSDYDHRAFVNFCAYVIAQAVPARLGKEWSQFDPAVLAERFLGWFSPGQERICFPVVAGAFQLAADYNLGLTPQRLLAIESALPPLEPARRKIEDVWADQLKLPQPSSVRDLDKRRDIQRRLAALDAETQAILYDDGTDSAGHLRRTIALARRQLQVADDGAQLLAWALSNSGAQQWALQRLARVDPIRYADALEVLLLEADQPEARLFFNDLRLADPVRAAALVRNPPVGLKEIVAVSQWELLCAAEKLADENTRVTALLQFLDDPKSGSTEHDRALELLVPPDAPLRYPGRQVDDAILKLLESRRPDKAIDFNIEMAFRALALRGRTDLFERLARQFESRDEPVMFVDVAGALAQLVQADPERFQPQFQAMLKPHVPQTNWSAEGILWAAWSADLRELQPDLERLATRSADEPENPQPVRIPGLDIPERPGPVRYHLARKILNLWSEPDAFTRARALVALAIWDSDSFTGASKPERLARMKAEMSRAGAALPPEAKLQLSAFLNSIDAHPPLEGAGGTDQCRKITAYARTAFQL